MIGIHLRDPQRQVVFQHYDETRHFNTSRHDAIY